MNALAIFLSYIHARNSTAVCIYTIKMIENIFENSKFKGYNDNVPTPRPGTVRTLLCCYVTLQKQNLQTTSSKLFYFYISIFVLLTCSLSSLFYIMCMSTTCGFKKKKKKDMETAVCMDCFITFIASIIETVVIYLTSTEIKWNK